MIIFLLFALFQSADIPLKPADEFAVTIDFKLKPRPGVAGGGSNARVTITEIPLRPTPTYLGGKYPYIRFKISLLKLSDQEVRVKVSDPDNITLVSKKVKQGEDIMVDAGFIDQIKDRPKNTEYDCVLLSAKRQPVSRIHITVDLEGNYFVNGKKLGKF